MEIRRSCELVAVLRGQVSKSHPSLAHGGFLDGFGNQFMFKRVRTAC